MAHGVGHEAGFDPFAALFEVLKNLNSSIWLLCACGVRRGLRSKEKARPGGPRLGFSNSLLYIFSIAF